ncbi:MAG: phosphate ABC transporter permease subunit PstC [Bifidobacteriaceae bacterium]|jgi:phosphate transport system permease protein|nr:phosphate ABC transporter permease subunit PstC [Bifidobacteriaceae bacterium]
MSKIGIFNWHRLFKTDKFYLLVCASSLFVLIILFAITVFLLFSAMPALESSQTGLLGISWYKSSEANNILDFCLPLVFSTILSSLLALVIALPVSIGVALFITFYAPPKLAAIASWVIDILASIPSIVYGLWGIFVLCPFLNVFTGNLISSPPRVLFTLSIVLAVMIIPIITSIIRDIYTGTPHLDIEAAYGLGATKWEMIRLSVLPYGAQGAMSAAMLGLGRALGETMAVLIILSPGRSYSFNIFGVSSHQTIAGNIAAQFPEANSLGVSLLTVTGLVLFIITFLVNWAAKKIAKSGVANV